MEAECPIRLRGGPFSGLEVPGLWADSLTGEIILSTVLHAGRFRFIDRPVPLTVTYLRSAPGVATYSKSELTG